MKIICGNRMSGKTEALLKQVDKTSIIIVCISESSKEYVKLRAKEMNLQIQEPITYKQLAEGNIKGRFAFEDIDAVINGQFCLGKGSVSIATISVDAIETLIPTWLTGDK